MMKKDIGKGPSKQELAAALTDGKMVEFTLSFPGGETTANDALITTLGTDDEFRHIWNIKGRLFVGGRHFSARYDTRDGTGNMEIEG